MINTEPTTTTHDCPDDDSYECYKCGEPTGNGYDDGVCAQCGADDE
jgi:hypothetical protein